MNIIGIILSLVVTVIVAVLIIKKYKPQAVLLGGGMLLLIAAEVLGIGTVFAPDSGTGFWLFDVFEYVKVTMSKDAAATGMIIMAVGGFSVYMNHIGAGEAMVGLCAKPLKKVGSPYIVLALAYVLGQILNIFIPSAAGLAVLLMATVYPILIALGVSRLSATAVIATTACLDLGPASGASNIASEIAGIDAMTYFVKYQMSVSVAVIIVITILHYIVQKMGDKKAGHIIKQLEIGAGEQSNGVPTIYAILPIIPLALLLTFNKFVITSIKMDVITAMLIGLTIALIFEMIRKRDVGETCKSIQVFFDGMGKQFATTVTLIVAAETFAQGLQVIGLIDSIIEGAKTLGMGPFPMTVIMVCIISATAIVTGSGNAAFISFAALAPIVSESFGVHSVSLLLAMQLSAGIARSMSPVASCVIAPAGYADVSPMDVAKRTVIPMLGGIITLLIADLILYM